MKESHPYGHGDRLPEPQTGAMVTMTADLLFDMANQIEIGQDMVALSARFPLQQEKGLLVVMNRRKWIEKSHGKISRSLRKRG